MAGPFEEGGWAVDDDDILDKGKRLGKEAYDWYKEESKGPNTNLEHGDEYKRAAEERFRASQNRAAPQAGRTTLAGARMGNAANINMSPQEQWRQQQMGLAGQLSNQAQGRGPSVAGAQFKAATDTNLAQQQALAAGARGGNTAMARRQAGNNASNFSQQAAQQAAIGRQQEQLNAQTQLGGLLNQGRAGDIGLATDQARFQQQTNIANQGATNAFSLQQGTMDQQRQIANIKAQLEQSGLDDAAQQEYLRQLIGMDASELSARTAGGSTGIGGDIMAGIGTIASWFSDENLKHKIEDGSSSSQEFLDNIKPSKSAIEQALFNIGNR